MEVEGTALGLIVSELQALGPIVFDKNHDITGCSTNRHLGDASHPVHTSPDAATRKGVDISWERYCCRRAHELATIRSIESQATQDTRYASDSSAPLWVTTGDSLAHRKPSNPVSPNTIARELARGARNGTRSILSAWPNFTQS